MKRWIVALSLFCACYSYGQSQCSPNLPTDICDFEVKVYTETNFKNTPELKQVMVEFKNLLKKHVNASLLIQEHLLTLGDQILEEAHSQRAPKAILRLADGKRNLLGMLKKLRKWEVKNGQIVPLDWQLPKGFAIGVTSLQRSYNISTDRLRYSISFFSILEKNLEIEQFKMSRYGGATIIDKQSDIGDWNEGVISYGNDPYFSANSAHQDAPMQDGLYLISIKIKDQPSVEGWFFLHGTSATNPTVQIPQAKENFTTDNPTFHFQDYISNAILPSDARKLSVKVFREGNSKNVWNTSYINPKNLTSIILGKDINQKGITSLTPGSYRLDVTYEERSYFGDLTVGRLIETKVPFGVSK